MPAIIGVAIDVPPTRVHVSGVPGQGVLLASHTTYACPQTPFAANSATSGTSRTPSLGLPTSDCQLGLAYPAQVPLTTLLVLGVPVAHPLGPPPPATVLRNRAPGTLLQKPDVL